MSDITLSIMIDDITVEDGRREINSAAVKKLAQSIEQVGLQHPITVKRKGGGYLLIAGRHRLEAFKKLGREHITASIVTMTKDEARLWEISENLHRSDLSNIEKAEHIEEWREITERLQVRNCSAPKQPADEGIRKTAENFGIDEKTVRNSGKIAKIDPAAKQAATQAGVTTVRELLEVAAAAPAAQVAKVAALSTARTDKKKVRTDDRDVDYSPKEAAARLRGAFILRAEDAASFAFYDGKKVDAAMIASAEATALAWCQMVDKLGGKEKQPKNLDDWISEFSVQICLASTQLTETENMELADCLKQIVADLERRAAQFAVQA